MSIKYKMSASSCFRNITWVENKLSDDKDYQFLKKYKSKIEKKQEDLNEFQFYLIDSTEIEIERPNKKLQLEYFSGKSWMFSIKFQIIYDFLIKKLLIFLLIMENYMIFKY
ncbi:hypothetical protein [Spiroplasma ixodetis]|uniref:Transposase n=1 Tax=Spiroplasma ixodetis TaxID=2141 RepID=A0ABM8JPA2_9MOLU